MLTKNSATWFQRRKNFIMDAVLYAVLLYVYGFMLFMAFNSARFVFKFFVE